MFTNILIPLDGSPFAEKALPYALTLADQFQSQITLISVLEPPSVTTDDWAAHVSDALAAARQRTRDQRVAYIKEVCGRLQEKGYSAVCHVLESDARAAEAILDAVSLYKADAIVMTTHGRTGIARMVLGSVAERLIRHADVPTLLIRIPEDGRDA